VESTDGFLIEMEQGRSEERFVLGEYFFGGWSFVRIRLVIERWNLRQLGGRRESYAA